MKSTNIGLVRKASPHKRAPTEKPRDRLPPEESGEVLAPDTLSKASIEEPPEWLTSTAEDAEQTDPSSELYRLPETVRWSGSAWEPAPGCLKIPPYAPDWSQESATEDLRKEPVFFRNNPYTMKKYAAFLRTEAKRLWRSGFVKLWREVSNKPLPSLISPLVVADQADKLRLCVNFQYLNQFIRQQGGSLPQIYNITELVAPNDVLSKSDMKSGYHQWAVDDSAIEFMGFIVEGLVFVYVTAPFGLSDLPSRFQQHTSRALKCTLHSRKNLRGDVYIDDFFWAHQAGAAVISEVLQELTQKGFVFSKKKTQLQVPSIEMLGFIIDAKEMTLSVSEKKWTKYRQQVTESMEDTSYPRGTWRSYWVDWPPSNQRFSTSSYLQDWQPWTCWNFTGKKS
jgi:hypothetical protein